MSENKPVTLATQLEAQVDDAQRLRRKRPALFWIVVTVGSIFGLAWAYERFWGKAGIEKQLAEERQTSRDLRAQLTLAETRLAPFKAIAIDRYGDDSGKALVQLGKDMEKFQSELKRLQTKLDAAEAVAIQAKRTADRASAINLPRRLTPEFERELKRVTTGYKKIDVTAVMGDGEALQFATAILTYLRGRGLTVDGVNQSVFAVPVVGQRVTPKGDTLQLIIGTRQ